MRLSTRLIAWQKVNGRHGLPWQGSRDPYRIWLSEVMLQQTQVVTVLPYFRRFVERFPNVRTLAAAPIDAVMSTWSGLGYYSRARHLHRCAQEIVARHGGRFPRSAEVLAQLPGIGRSTAAAIAAFAWGVRAPILDGNVKRVLTRHFGIEGYPGDAATERHLWQIAESELPDMEIEAYTQGLMDLGSAICTPRTPGCAQCPLRASCVASRDGRTAQLPTPRAPRARPLREAAVALIRDAEGAVLFERRPPSGIWGGLLSAPEFDGALSDVALAVAVEERFGLRVVAEGRSEPMRHEFTHYTFVMHPRWLRSAGAAAAHDDAGVLWYRTEDLADAPLPAPIRRLVLGDRGPK
ncbi:MAG TPA: A/G-specific adenine glycosylase [Burkholderiaceae bacterium]|nr:A/G-specific adenine glycosylase [Burkholderiaceae bacterium]